MTLRISILVDPLPERKLPFAVGVERYRRFAEELGQFTGVEVPILQDSLPNAPDDAYILFAGHEDLSRSLATCAPDKAAALGARLVLLDVGWQQALVELERHRLAGAIDSLRMSEWLARPSSGKGLFGLRYLAKSLGGSCASLPWFQSKHYCRLDSDHHRGLPHLLADYLAAYDRDRQSLSDVEPVSVARVPPGPGEREAGTSTMGLVTKDEPMPPLSR